MTKTFVAINDPVHSLIRSVTRHTPLVRRPFAGSDACCVQYSFREQDLPEAYYSLAVFHALGGLSLKSLRRAQVAGQRKRQGGHSRAGQLLRCRQA